MAVTELFLDAAVVWTGNQAVIKRNQLTQVPASSHLQCCHISQSKCSYKPFSKAWMSNLLQRHDRVITRHMMPVGKIYYAPKYIENRFIIISFHNLTLTGIVPAYSFMSSWVNLEFYIVLEYIYHRYHRHISTSLIRPFCLMLPAMPAMIFKTRGHPFGLDWPMWHDALSLLGLTCFVFYGQNGTRPHI